MSHWQRPLLWPVALAAVAVTCTSDELTLPNEGLPAAIASVSGSGQTGTVGAPLPDSLVVRITDSEDRPVEGAKVVFTPVLGGGDAIPDTGVTNSDGRTGARWLLGTTAGTQRVQAMVVGATAGGALTQLFDATALAAPADTIFAVRGNNQSAEVNAVLPDSLVVRVTDRFGNPVSATAVTWLPTGGGTVSPGSAPTGSTGYSATRRTLGPAAGPQGATATAPGLKGSPVTFSSTALPAAPTSLTKVSGDGQTAAAGSALPDSLVVVLRDVNGNGVPGRNVTFAVATGGGTTSPTSATTDATGRAATRWTLGTAAGPNSLIATSSGFSVTFGATATSAAAANIAAVSPTSQTDTAGFPAAAPPSVRVTDVNGNPVAGVSVTFAVTGGGGSILPTSPIPTNAAGIATLSTWTLGGPAGANSVTATVSGLSGSPVSFSATGVAGSAARLQVQTQPSPAAQSGVALAVQPAVRLLDVFGNPVTTGSVVVTAALASGSGTLGGTLTANTSAGVATFTNLAITGPTGAYTIQFTSGSLVPDTSAVVTIGAGAATRLAMVTQPSASAQNATAFAQQPRVQVQDAAGNPVAGVRSVTVAINTGGGVLGGTATINTNGSGLATFAGLSITGSTGNRTLVFTSAGLTQVVSSAVSITAGAPTQMAVSAGNGQTATAGSAVAVPPSVVIRDVSNNPVSGVSVTFAVASGGGSVLPATPVATNSSGVAAATSWTLGPAAGANTLTANAAPAGITGDPVTFTATAVAGGAGRLGMVTQPPATSVNGATLATAPVVQLQDVNGNPVTTAGIAITVAIGSGPGGSVLAGGTTVGTDATGRAAFPGLSITGPVGSYTLQFTSPGLTGVASSAIGLTPGAATQVTLTTQPPATAQSGVAMAPATVAQLQDVSGNAVSSAAVNITATIASGGGTLTGTTTVATNASGAASFGNLVLTGTIGSRTLTFGAAGLTADVSTAINLVAGPAASVRFLQEPTAVVAGAVIAPSPTVRVLDGAGNLVTSPAQTVALTISTNPGGATLGGTTSVATVSGVATFSTLTLNRAGTGYRLRAAAGALVPDTSAVFNVTAGAATTIAANSATAQTDTAGLPVTAPPSVLVTDANGNPVAGVPVTFTVTVGGGSRLPVTPVTTNAAGIAALTSWTLGNTAGANTLTATAAGLTGSPVTFSATGVAGAATQLVIQTQPSAAAQSGVAFVVQPVVRVADAFGNTVTTSTAVLTAALATGSGTLGGTLTATAASGVASFTNLSVSGPAGAYTVRFTSGALTPDTTTSITLGAGAAARLAVAQQPSATVQNAMALPQQPTVQLQDGAGNPVGQAGVVVTAAIASGGGVLGGTLTSTTNAAGLATFTNLVITGTAGARTLGFASLPLTGATSGAISVTAGAATQISINGGSGLTATVGTATATPPSALVRDVSGNPVAGVSVTFAVTGGGGSVLPVSAVLTNASGVAAATSWTLGTVAGANGLSATSAGLTGSPLGFTATGAPGAAAQVVILTQPSAAAQSGVAFAVQPVVRIADAFGNTVPSASPTVTAALASGTGTMGGTLSAVAASGVATFTNLSIAGVAGAYTLRFTAPGLTPDTSTAVTLGAGSAARLAVAQQPSATAQNAVAFAQQPTVQLQDGAGNPVAQAGVVVTAAIATGGPALGGTLTATTNAAGLAAFTNLVVTGTIGARTLAFTSPGLTPDTSGTVTISAGAATQVALNAGNGQSATVNTAVAVPPSVVVRDVSGNVVAGVSVSFAVSGGGGSILPVTPVATNASGIAALTSWTLGTTAGANALQATSAGLAGSPVNFTATSTAGAATQLQVATQPSTTAQSGVVLAIQPAVRLADAFGNAVTTSGTTITAAIGSGGGTLGGTVTANTVTGVATFTNLAISGTAGPRTLAFTSPGLTGVSSGTITLGAGAASRLAVIVQPSASVQNAIAFPQQPQVQVQDAAGNPVSGVVSVTASIATGGGLLGGTATVNTNAAGLATFTNLVITGSTGARTLSFASTGLTSATSSAVTVTAGVPTSMAVNAGNGQTATAGSQVAVDPSVVVRDVSSNPVPGVSVTFAVASGGGAVLPATPVVTNASGIAAATSWTLGTVAGANSLTADAAPAGITGDPVTFTATAVAGTAGRLAMFTQPSVSAQSGAVLAQVPVVQLQDTLGNPVSTSGVGINVSIASGPGGTLSGGTIALTNAGLATFTGLGIVGPAGSYTLLFSGTGLTGVTSSAITLTAGAAARIAVVTQPTTAQSGIAFGTAPVVQVQDAAGNPVGGAGRNVVVSLNSGAATLSGTLTQQTNGSGAVTFPGLVLTGPIGPHTLLFSSAALTSDTTGVITLTPGTATAIEYVQPPTAVVAGQAITPAPSLRIRDGAGNTVTTATNTVSMAIGTNPGGSTLGGTTSVAAVAGVATFGTLSLNRSGVGYTLAASSAGLSGATSGAFNVTAGTATALAITTAPSTGQSGVLLAPQPVVRLVDALGNTVQTTGTLVTAALASGPGALGGTLTATTSNGVASFANLVITGTAGAYTLNFSAPGVTGVTTGVVTLSAGAPAALAFQVQPSAVASGAAMAPAVTVRVLDGAGNLVPTASNSVTLAIGTNPGGSTLGGTTTVAAAGGVASFSTLALYRTGTGYTLTAAAAGLTGATSTAFNVTPGPATRLAYLTPPSDVTAGAVMAPAVRVEVLDSAGNLVTGAANTIGLAIGTNPGGSTLGGTTSAAAVGGIATFSTLTLNRTGAGYTLAGSAAGLAGVTSAGFAVTPGAATALAITSQPTTGQSGAVLATSLVIRLVDANGNTVPTTGTQVTAGLATGPGTLSGTLSAGTVNGVATFSNLVLTGTAGSYTLTLASTGLSSVTTATIALSPGSPFALAFQAQPTTVQSGAAITPAVTVRVLDSGGNLVPTATNTVTMAIGTNPGGGVLGGTVSTPAVGGVATFSNLTINRTGTGYTLAATAGGLTSATSSAFNVTPGAASRVAFLVQPPASATAGASIAPAVQVEVQDLAGNRVTSATNTVTMAIGNNPGGSTLGGTTSVAAVGGVASFSTLSLNRTGTLYTLAASSAGLTGATSTSFDVVPGAAAALAITTAPASGQSGVVLSPQPAVRVVDGSGNTVPANGTVINAALASGPGALGGTLTAATTNGVASFSNLALTGTAGSYTVNFSATGLTGVTTGTITLAAGPAAALAFQVQPSAVAAGISIAPSVLVRVVDGAGNTVPSATNAITVAIGANPGGSALGGTLTVSAVSGIATFANLTLDRVGTGYTLTAAATGLTGTTSTGFNVSAGAATGLAITTAPTTGQSGIALAPQPAIRLVDAFGNSVLTSGTVVTAAIGSGTGTLGGTLTASTLNGVATFANLAISGTAGAFTLSFTAPSLAGISSAPITISAGTPVALAYTVQPTTVTAGSAISPPVQVRIIDGSGNTVTTATNTIALAIGNNPGTATLGGTTSTAAVAGVASFGTLSLNRSGVGYDLVASAAGLTGATSSGFTVNPGAATTLAISTPPTGGQNGSPITPQPVVRLVDGLGNTVPTTGTLVTATLASGSGALANATATTANGVATFSGLTFTGTAGSISLSFGASGVSSVLSASFLITAGAPAAVAFTQQPSTSVAGVNITPTMQVQVVDGSGNTVTTATNAITLAILDNPGSGTLSGTATQAASAGSASFPAMSINRTGVGYTLRATATGLASDTSIAFSITPAAASALAFIVQPSTVTAGASIAPPVQVEVRDALGNRVTGSTASITMAFGTNTGGGTLGGTTTVSALDGVASFGSLSINRSAAGYTLAAASSGLTGATSSAFTVNPGLPAALLITTMPATAQSGVAFSPQPVIRVVDADSNTVPVNGTVITAAIASGGGSLGGANTATTSSGVATFAGLSLSGTVGAHTLNFSSAPLTGINSGAIALSAGTPAALAFQVQPSNATSGAAIAPAVLVRVVDGAQNTVTTATNAITLAIGTNPSGGTLFGTPTANAVAGVASFPTLSINRAGNGYTLAGSATGLTGATSLPFNVTAGTASRLAFAGQPTSAVAGAALSPAVQVEVLDTAGNRVISSAANVSIEILNNVGGSTLGGTTSLAAVSGLASFPTLSLNRIGAGYTLRATATGLGSDTSAAFTITAGTPAALVFATQPTSTTVGAAIAPPVTVRIEDALGNLTGSTANVSLAFGANPGAATLNGTTSVAAVSGVAAFGTLSVSAGGTAYTLIGSSGALTPDTSAAFNITAAATTTAITSDLSTATVVGQGYTVNFSVASAGGTPTGSVTVSDGTGGSCGPVALTGGAGSCVLTSTTASAKSVTATYAGDVNFAGSASVGTAHTVNQALTTTSISSHQPDPSTTAQVVTVVWSVPPVPPGAGTPTGTVTVTTDGAETCSAAVGVGSCTFTFTATGARTITATYGGDAQFVGSASVVTPHQVN